MELWPGPGLRSPSAGRRYFVSLQAVKVSSCIEVCFQDFKSADGNTTRMRSFVSFSHEEAHDLAVLAARVNASPDMQFAYRILRMAIPNPPPPRFTAAQAGFFILSPVG